MALPNDWDGRPLVIGTGVLIDGATASKLTDVLTIVSEHWRRNGRDLPEVLLVAADAFRVAGDRWEGEARRRFRDRNHGTSAPDEELMLGEMTTADVAKRLGGISTRAVTKRAPELGGRKVGHRWLFDGVTIEAAAQRREECSNVP